MNYRYELDKTSKKFICPSCGKKVFVRYIEVSTGNYAPDGYGKCDRAANCAFHEYPRSEAASFEYRQPRAAFTTRQVRGFDYLETQHVLDSLDSYDRNAFVQWLINLFPEDLEAIEDVLARYLVGTFEHRYGPYTMFPYFDQERRLCFAKLMRFNAATGNRKKGDYDTSSLRTRLKIEPFNRKITYFGEHLLPKFRDLPVAIVESEKTAIIATLCDTVFPEAVWLATGSLSVLTADRLLRCCKGRKVVLYPDAGGFERWSTVAADSRKLGLDVRVSTIIEDIATDAEKQSGFDIADYLIREQSKINAHNLKLARYCSIEEAAEREAIRAEGCGEIRGIKLQAVQH